MNIYLKRRRDKQKYSRIGKQDWLQKRSVNEKSKSKTIKNSNIFKCELQIPLLIDGYQEMQSKVMLELISMISAFHTDSFIFFFFQFVNSFKSIYPFSRLSRIRKIGKISVKSGTTKNIIKIIAWTIVLIFLRSRERYRNRLLFFTPYKYAHKYKSIVANNFNWEYALFHFSPPKPFSLQFNCFMSA